MDYIGPRGISLDVWSGWSDLAQQAALAWSARESDACPAGHHRDQWDPDEGGDLLSRLSLRSRVCPACEIAQRRQENNPEPWPGEYAVWGSSEDGDEREEHDGADEQEDHAEAAGDHDGVGVGLGGGLDVGGVVSHAADCTRD